jgi:D-glycero-D-manno-heptose 1,7-bisphosphate phosphatase
MLGKYSSLNNLDLVILAGGKGSRIKKLLGKYPKPMLKFNKKHFIQYILNNKSKYNFKRIIILCGFRSDIFFKKFHKKKINFSEIICIKEKKLLGTGGALANLKKLKVKDFILTNGDTIFDIDVDLLVSSLKKNSIGAIALKQNTKQKSKKLNNLIVKNNFVSIKQNSKLMNGGTYFFKKSIFKYISNKSFSLEDDLLPRLISMKKINGKIFNNFFIDIGSTHYFRLAEKLLKEKYTRPSIFLDRDGVINHDYGYVHDIKNFKFRPGVVKGLKYLTKKNFFIFIITNQAGIGKKKFLESEFIQLHKNINNKLKKINIFFNDIQYSPYHPEAKIEKYKKNSSMRKPGNKMIKNIKLNWDIQNRKSFMIGDKITDKLTAKKSDLKFYYAAKNFYKQVKSIISNY